MSNTYNRILGLKLAVQIYVLSIPACQKIVGSRLSASSQCLSGGSRPSTPQPPLPTSPSHNHSSFLYKVCKNYFSNMLVSKIKNKRINSLIYVPWVIFYIHIYFIKTTPIKCSKDLLTVFVVINFMYLPISISPSFITFAEDVNYVIYTFK